MGAALANPQVENGYIRIANEIWDALVAIRISGEARQVLDFIIRKTWGWGKKVDKISLSQLCDATGLKKSSVIKARKKLVDMNMLFVTQKVNDTVLTYGIIKDYRKWKPVPKKLTVPKSKTSMTQKVNKPVPKKLPTKDNNKDTITKNNTAGNVKIQFNRKTWAFENITQERVDRWSKAYPGVDIWTEILRAGSYLENHPERKYSNYSSFLDNWFKRAKPEIQESEEKPDSYYCT